jgi:hypothetical protein
MGRKWVSISKLMPGRSDNAIKNRWYTCLGRREPRETETKPGLANGKVDKEETQSGLWDPQFEDIFSVNSWKYGKDDGFISWLWDRIAE